ncbi:MAG: hypothetical protein LBC82_04725 [Oscillospiraceae bacterium]|jgi:hypothetical protein|nr:hypothetical protein [Oscillospiraceae bacterium]
MKNKLIATLLTLSLILTLTACGGDTEPSGNNDITTPTTTTAPVTTTTPSEPETQDLDNSNTPDNGDYFMTSFTGDGSEEGMISIWGISIKFNGQHEQDKISWSDLSDFELEKDGTRIALDRSNFNDDIIFNYMENFDRTTYVIHFTSILYDLATYDIHFKLNGVQRQAQPVTLISGYVPPVVDIPTPDPAPTPDPTPTLLYPNTVVYSSPQIAELANQGTADANYFRTLSNNYLIISIPHGVIYGYNRHAIDDLRSFDGDGNVIYRVVKRTFENEEFAQLYSEVDLKGEVLAIVGNVAYFVVDSSNLDTWTKHEHIEVANNSGFNFVDSMP